MHLSRSRKRSLTHWAITGLFFAVVVSTWWLTQSYIRSSGAEIMNSWLQSEAINIQEGNLLTSVSSHRRVLLSSQIVTAIVLLDDQVKTGVPEILISFGEPIKGLTAKRGVVPGKVTAEMCGFFDQRLFFRFPGNRNLLLIFDLNPALGYWLFGGVTSLFMTFILVSFVLSSRKRQHEEETRLNLLKMALSELKSHKGPSAELARDFPTISSSWSELKAVVQELANEMAEQARNAAVARMTQMLAHDVRKPFSILRMGLGMLGNAKDPAGVKKVLSRLIPEIDKAVSSVDGLIADVMEVGSNSTKLIQEPASPESLIEATLGEIFRVYPKVNVAISYDLQHTHMANVHVQKVGRVFSNIVGNAVQAMGQKGEIWFKTREQGDMIEFSVGNAGSVIPVESLPKLFDAFFTSGKKGGTGLGLAIAEKVVKAHGGRIWCESEKTAAYPTGYVEFKFTLPTSAGQICKTTARPPGHSSELMAALLTLEESPAEQGSVDKSELTLEEEIIHASNNLGRPLRVLVVDDEAIYRGALAAYLSRTPELSSAMNVIQASSSRAALSQMAEEATDLVITDVDMGQDSLDGFELVAAMRAAGMQALICVHSNRIVAADHKTATIAGADAFLPKPVARAQLLRLVLQAAQASQQTCQSKRQGAVAEPTSKPEVLVVDDNIFVLEAWESALAGDAIVHSIASLEDLDARLETDPGFAGRLLLAVTDMHLDGSAGDGLDVGRLLKRHRPGLRVLLSSDGVIAPSELVGAVDMAIGKDPVRLATLSTLF